MSYPTYDLTLKQYAERAKGTAAYPLQGSNMVYPALKLAGEAGELADKIGKHWRNNWNYTMSENVDEQYGTKEGACLGSMNVLSMTPDQRTNVLLELGDVLWYVAAIADEMKASLETVAQMNLEKLAGRRQRGTILSEGDNR